MAVKLKKIISEFKSIPVIRTFWREFTGLPIPASSFFRLTFSGRGRGNLKGGFKKCFGIGFYLLWF